jgi:hypothetical protein
MVMKKTIISHFYNEEYMLPWFLKHHKQIFDHGVLIDYHSTDRSVEIIKEICPTWDIVTSRNQDFQADNIDIEVMEIERQIDGWKIALNVTEQMIGDYSILDDRPGQWLIPTIFMVDSNRDHAVTQDRPLYEQKFNGFSFRDSQQAFLERRSRSIHNVPVYYPPHNTQECMGPGRHYHTYNTDQLVIFYYGWCPFDDGGIARKLQIQTQIPLIDRQRGWGFHHITNKETLTYRLENEFIPRSRNLTEDINYYVTKHKDLSNIL